MGWSTTSSLLLWSIQNEVTFIFTLGKFLDLFKAKLCVCIFPLTQITEDFWDMNLKTPSSLSIVHPITYVLGTLRKLHRKLRGKNPFTLPGRRKGKVKHFCLFLSSLKYFYSLLILWNVDLNYINIISFSKFLKGKDLEIKSQYVVWKSKGSVPFLLLLLFQ